MTTNLEAIDILFTKLDGSSLKTAITGSICKLKRDADSNKEDVVINSLPFNNEQLQQGILNVNIHVPDVVVNVNNVQDKQPDFARLKTLADMAVEILDDNWASTYNFSVQQQNVMHDPEAGSHYVNIRIEFFIINT